MNSKDIYPKEEIPTYDKDNLLVIRSQLYLKPDKRKQRYEELLDMRSKGVIFLNAVETVEIRPKNVEIKFEDQSNDDPKEMLYSLISSIEVDYPPGYWTKDEILRQLYIIVDSM